MFISALYDCSVLHYSDIELLEILYDFTCLDYSTLQKLINKYTYTFPLNSFFLNLNNIAQDFSSYTAPLVLNKFTNDKAFGDLEKIHQPKLRGNETDMYQAENCVRIE